jgi:regulator of protease activity HflC (stomatin/prohibitin superfamily)
VFVDVSEQAVLERLGRRMEGVLEPGMHVKYPWPIDQAYKVATAQVHELKVGVEPPASQEKKEELILWTNKHEQEPHLEVLVATPKLAQFIREVSATRPSGAAATRPSGMTAATAKRPAGSTTLGSGEAVAVSLMRVAVTIQYTIRDAYQWLTTYDHPEEMLKAIANREINRYCASLTVEGLIGGERSAIEQGLWKAIQGQVDQAKLGVDLKFLGLQGVHPPESTAQDFQDVVGAEQKMAAAIRAADAEYNKKLSEVAGDVDRARDLAELIRKVDELEKGNADTPELASARAERDALFVGDAGRGIVPVGGKAAEIRAKARAERWRIENDMRSRAGTFLLEIAAKQAAPIVYHTRRIFEALAQSGDAMRKYVVASDGTLQLNLQDPMSANIETAIEKESP